MTTKDLEYYTDLLDKAVAGSRGLTPILKEILLWVKCYQTALLQQRNCEESIDLANFTVVLF